MKLTFDLGDVFFTDSGEIRVSIDGYTLSDDDGNAVTRLLLLDTHAKGIEKKSGLYLPPVKVEDFENFFRLVSGGEHGIPFVEREEANKMVKDHKKKPIWYERRKCG